MNPNPEEPVFVKTSAFYATTSSNHEKGSGYWKVEACDYVEARTKLFAALEDKWCFLYTSLEDVHPLDRKCHGVIK